MLRVKMSFLDNQIHFLALNLIKYMPHSRHQGYREGKGAAFLCRNMDSCLCLSLYIQKHSTHVHRWHMVNVLF